ncbi:MAG: prepilin-type N-terminal cleavage/methylation domain-containing protein [Verrucomicrobiota bacterium]
MKRREYAFSLIELLISMTILSLTILTVIGLVPVLIQTHQESREMVQGKNLMGDVLMDLKKIPPSQKRTLLYGIRFDPNTVRVGNTVECSFDQEGVYLPPGRKKESDEEPEFYFIQMKIEKVEENFNRIHIRAQMSVKWPDPNEKAKKNVHKMFSLPVAMSYEK